MIAAALIAGATVYLAGGTLNRALFGAPPQAARTTSLALAPQWQKFTAACVAAFQTEWPNVPGWSPQRYGCEPGSKPGQARAFRTLTLDPGHNLLIATRVAQMMFKAWKRPAEVKGATITTSVPLQVSWAPWHKPAVPPSGTTPLLAQAQAAFVGIATSVTGTATGTVTVTATAGLSDMLARFDRLSDAAILSIAEAGGVASLKLGPIVPFTRVIPVEEHHS